MNLSRASILLFAAMPSLSVGLDVSSSSALLQDESRRLGRRTERSKAKKRMFSSSSSSDDLLPPFTNPKPKDVCIQEMQAYKIKGSATPIAGKTGLSLDPADDFNVNPACVSVIPDFTDIPSFLDTVDAYYSCLATPAAGPVISGKWWFNRDIPSPAPPATENSGQFRFEPGYVCGEITGTEEKSRTKFELWEDAFINLPLANFTEFSVEYEIRGLATNPGSEAYVNVYMRAGENSNFFDCRLDFLAQDLRLFTTGDVTSELVIDHTTTTTSVDGNCTAIDSPPYSIGGYLSEHPDAVFGVGNGELYTFTLDTGSTNQDNQGLEVCWANVMITTTNEFGDTEVDGYAFDLQDASTQEESRRLGRRTERSKAKKRMFSSSSSSDDLLPPFTNPKPKDVCIQEMQAYKIKGSATPIVGPTTDNPVCPPGTLNDALLAAYSAGSSQPVDDYLSCLATPAAGPVISGKWWFDRDIPLSPGIDKLSNLCTTIDISYTQGDCIASDGYFIIDDTSGLPRPTYCCASSFFAENLLGNECEMTSCDFQLDPKGGTDQFSVRDYAYDTGEYCCSIVDSKLFSYNSGQFRFEPGYVCGNITGTEKASRTKFELWEEALIGLPLANFTEFSVEYEIRGLAMNSGSEAYVNVYMRADPLTNTGDNFYDCRLDFLAQDSSLFTSGDATRELVIDHTTTTTSFGARNGFSCGDSSPYSIGGFLAKYSDAVFGVGNTELYTFTLDTGSSNQDNQGLEVCWANVMITTTNAFGDTEVDGYAFDVL